MRVGGNHVAFFRCECLLQGTGYNGVDPMGEIKILQYFLFGELSFYSRINLQNYRTQNHFDNHLEYKKFNCLVQSLNPLDRTVVIHQMGLSLRQNR